MTENESVATFKVGDRVRVTEIVGRGDVGTIASAYTHVPWGATCYKVYLDSKRLVILYAHELALVEGSVR